MLLLWAFASPSWHHKNFHVVSGIDRDPLLINSYSPVIPLGPKGIVAAFNFPIAVRSWNATLAPVCGNPVI
jgi:acyl-CoA reductase-like NAD-dependent aldehyde dehydrogenase